MVNKEDLQSLSVLQPKAKVIVLARVSELTQVTNELGVAHEALLSRPIKASSLFAAISTKEKKPDGSRAPKKKSNNEMDKELGKVRNAFFF